VPANARAIVLKAEPGEELTCRAHSFRPGGRDRQIERGVLSYYAVETLGRAETMESWLAAIRAALDAGRRRGQLEPPQSPSLQVLGDPESKVPGRAGAGPAR
jgi:hypothetical protein